MPTTYVRGAELPDLAITYLDDAGEPVDFSTGFTFALTLTAQGESSATVTKTTGISGEATAPNIVVAWAVDELDIDPARYALRVVATRDSDSKDFVLDDSLTIVDPPAITTAQLATIRGLVGTATPPTDADLAVALERLGTTDKVALEVLQGRLATMLSQPSRLEIVGDVSVDTADNIKGLTAVVDRLTHRVANAAGDQSGLVTRLVRTGSLRR